MYSVVSEQAMVLQATYNPIHFYSVGFSSNLLHRLTGISEPNNVIKKQHESL